MNQEQIETIKEFKRATNLAVPELAVAGTQFFLIKEYKNEHGEVANYHLNGGIKRSSVLQKSLKKYIAGQNDPGIFGYFAQKYGNAVAIKAFEEKIKSAETCIDGTNTRSIAQQEAYIYINPGMKYCIATQTLMIYAYLMNKETIIPGVYPVRNKRQLTLCKEEIDRVLNIKLNKYRLFKFNLGAFSGINIAGKTIEFPKAA